MWHRQTWRQNWRHLPTWREGGKWRRHMASKRGVTCPSGVREPAGIARRGVKTWLHLPTGVREASGVATWRQTVASPHVAPGSQLASPDVASKRCVTCPPGVREADGVARCGVKTWRHVPMWRQGARWRLQMWRQKVALAYMASGSHGVAGVVPGLKPLASLGVRGGGVKTWRARHVCSKCVFSRWAICAPPQATPLQWFMRQNAKNTVNLQ